MSACLKRSCGRCHYCDTPMSDATDGAGDRRVVVFMPARDWFKKLAHDA